MRLIDADELKKFLTGNNVYENCSGCAAKGHITCYTENAIKYVIDSQQTIDAEPVKHGHWALNEITEPCMEYDATCSCCGFTFTDSYDGYVDTRDCLYCMNCGAKMDEN